MSEMNIQQIQTTFIQLLQNMFHFEENVEIEQFNEDPNQTNEENFQQGKSICNQLLLSFDQIERILEKKEEIKEIFEKYIK